MRMTEGVKGENQKGERVWGTPRRCEVEGENRERDMRRENGGKRGDRSLGHIYEGEVREDMRVRGA